MSLAERALAMFILSKVVSKKFASKGGYDLANKAARSTVPVRGVVAVPMNTIIKFVPEQEAWIVERMGKFHRLLKPGLNILVPIIDKIKYVQCLKEIVVEIPEQSAITADNVTLSIDGVLYLRVINPMLASYGVDDPEFAITQLAQTTMRSELGRICLDRVFQERDDLNTAIVEDINKASRNWGVTCLRYEIRDVRLPSRVQDAMQMQVEAERRKRAAILESEGTREADINVAEGKRRARILASEAEREALINKADGEAQALLTIANARAKGLYVVADALGTSDGVNAASFSVAEQYINAFEKLAKEGSTVIIPNNVGDVSSTVTQFRDETKEREFFPEGYRTYHRGKNGALGGGAFILVNENNMSHERVGFF